MRLAVLVLAACAAAPHPRPAPPPEATIQQLTDDVMRAYDRGDHATFDALVASDYIHFEGSPTTRAEELDRLRKRRPGAPAIAKRTWTQVAIHRHPTSVLFTGKATEIQGGNDVHGGYKYVGWYTLQWVPEGGAWKLRYWTWQRAGENAMRDGWNDIYKNDVGFNKQPNKLLVDTVAGVTPGTALDLTMGQGRNALFLASQGWKVTGVDIANEGLAIARTEAEKRKLSIEMIEANIDTWDFGTNRWDLVTMIYAGERWFEKIKPSLKPGGLFVLEYFAYDPGNGQDDGIKPGTLAKAFADFEILQDIQVDGTPDWAMSHAKLQRFVARKR
jgi:SAM-dependent methyltransferase